MASDGLVRFLKLRSFYASGIRSAEIYEQKPVINFFIFLPLEKILPGRHPDLSLFSLLNHMLM